MKKILLIAIIATLLSSCGTPKPNENNTGSTAMKRVNQADTSVANINTTSNTFRDTPMRSQPLTIFGRTEPGALADLEGVWVLQSTDAVMRKAEPKNDTIRPIVQKRNTPLQKPTLHVAEKPGISFFGSNETFSGYTGCNKFSGRFSLTGTSLDLQSAAPSTKMNCMAEYDEDTFIKLLHRTNSFRINNAQLELLEGDAVLLVFERK